jgi:signal transduction histidine kinase
VEVDGGDEFDDLADTIHSLGKKLAQLESERRRSDQNRDDLLANLSHELRTPLTAMQGFLEALQDGLIAEEGRRKYYDVMYQETLHMNRLVDDLLELMKLEHNEATLSQHPVDVESLFHKLAFKFAQEAEEKGLELRIRMNEALPRAYADVDRLEQILTNLLKNAIKFTDRGSIDLHAYQQSDSVLIQVTDTGVGISETDQPRIWERFFKADRGRSRKNKGSGLGLAIVKELVELHGGDITVQSQLHQGTTFRVRIPMYREKAEANVVAKIGSKNVKQSTG